MLYIGCSLIGWAAAVLVLIHTLGRDDFSLRSFPTRSSLFFCVGSLDVCASPL